MEEDVLQLIGYHTGRAIEELDCAEATDTELARGRHMELSRLHLNHAGQLQAKEPPTSWRVTEWSTVLDMGEASREQGFREYGCR